MTYAVKEIFKTLQGEGAMSGRAAVFCRFAGCNLWSGREQDRASAHCTFCDTDFIGTNGVNGGKFKTAQALAAELVRVWEGDEANRFVVFTGGEPLLQIDDALVAAVHAAGFYIAVETNGTLAPPDGIDWLCVSPKGRNPLALAKGDELKLVFPQPDCMPETVAHLDFKQFWLQPMDGPHRAENTALAVAYCMQHPRWRLSLQMHKFIGIP
jgi:7-carboxy-7-deazaguanine synthase